MIDFKSITQMMVTLRGLQSRVNVAFEYTPKNSKSLPKVIVMRNTSRDIFTNEVWPLYKKLSSLISTHPLSDHSPLINQIKNSLMDKISDLIERENTILDNLSNPFKSDRTMGFNFLSLFSPSSGNQSFAPDPSDEPNGEKALQYFYNKATSYSGNDLPAFQDFLSGLSSKSPELISTIGFTARTIGLTDSQVQTAMEQVADQGQGQVPQNFSVFFNALGQAGENPSFWSAIKFVSWNTAQTLIQDAQSAGSSIQQGVMSTISLSKYLPWMLGIGVGLFIVTYASSLGGGPGKILKTVRDHVKAK